MQYKSIYNIKFPYYNYENILLQNSISEKSLTRMIRRVTPQPSPSGAVASTLHSVRWTLYSTQSSHISIILYLYFPITTEKCKDLRSMSYNLITN